jgi:methionyl aminopeptidase
LPEISLKTPEEIAKMRLGGKIAAQVLSELSKAAKTGVSVLELDSLAERIIREAGAKPSFRGFRGYPAATCISVNEEIVHGIPSDRKLKEGDIVGIDVGVLYEGFHTDSAVSVGIGKITPEAQKLLDTTKKALEEAIKIIKPGIHLGDIQAVIQEQADKAGFGIIRDLTGHGVGRSLQEVPSIPNYGEKGQGIVLKEGMVLAIEPMFSAGSWKINIKDDGWTVVTADSSLAAHFEHTIAVIKDRSEVLTK